MAARRPITASRPPSFLPLAGHPVRWAVLRELSASDRRVGELAEATGMPQNAVSYHLRRLRQARIVTARRSAADGRDTYYRLDLDRCRDLLADAATALHPALVPERRSNLPRRQGRSRPVRVLFLCTGNSGRSPMAEALLAHLGGADVVAASAGSKPKPTHPAAIFVLRERGIDISGRDSRHLEEFVKRRFDYVITLCDRVREVLPSFAGHPQLVHWSVPDPAAHSTGAPPAVDAFRDVASDLHARVGYLLGRIDAG